MKSDFLTVIDLRAGELERLLRLAERCRRDARVGRHLLAGKTLALVFQKPSMRTRVSFEVAALQLGGAATYLGPDDVQIGTREPIKDAARTLSRYVDGVVVRLFAHRDVEEFARYASVPVINGLSDLHHPCQALADLLTIRQHCGSLKGRVIGYIGDGNNVLHSLAQGASLLGARLQAATPAGYRPHTAIWNALTRRGGARIAWSHDPAAAAHGADVLYTDVWTSMGFERERAARTRAFRGFRITRRLLGLAKPRCIVMHCLPAHRGEEIDEDVLEGPQSVVFDQAENRLHAQKALLMMVYATRGRR